MSLTTASPVADPVVSVPPRPGVVVLRLTAALAVPVSMALNLSVANHVTTGMVVIWGLFPFWRPVLVKARYGLALIAASALFLLGGYLIGWVSRADHVVPATAAITLGLTYASYIGGVGALVWAGRVIGIHWVIFAYGLALAAGAFLDPSSYVVNPWKFGFAVSVALIVLSVVDRVGSTLVKILALAALAAMSALNDYRSGLAMFAVAAAVLVWQGLRRHAVREPSIVALILGLLVVGGGVYYTVTRLLVSGLLGAELQSRSEDQVAASGSLLLGGRPEWTVTIRLFQEKPWGFGFGTIPSPADYELGREGFDSIHLLSQENYLKNYVFSGGLRLHSIAADLWAAAGPAGILLTLVVVWILVASLATALARRTASSVQIYVTLLALWNVGFSPVYTNFPQLVLALAIALAAVASGGPGRPAPAVVDPRPGLLDERGPETTSIARPVTGSIPLLPAGPTRQ